MKTEPPSPQSTLVILFGASEWPHYPDFHASEAFTNSARGVKEYFLDPSKFHLPKENLLDLFDSYESPDEIDQNISHFLDQRISQMKESNSVARDLLIYFVGHGGFSEGDSQYYLAIRRTRIENPIFSSIPVEALARTIKEKARYLRRILILDCCFAASASRFFQASEPAQIAITQTINAFKVSDKGIGMPSKGTSLLCSSRHNIPSLLSIDGKNTMFTKALLQALHTGDPSQQNHLSLHTIARLTEDFLHTIPEGGAPRPEIHSPDQSEGVVADTPLFPNFAARAIETISHYKCTLTEHAWPVKSVAISPNGQTLASGCLGGTIKVWDLQTVKLLRTLTEHIGSVESVSISSDGQILASGSADKTIKVWDLQTGELLRTLAGHVGSVKSIAISSDGQILASGSADKTIKVWDLQTGRLLHTLAGRPPHTLSSGIVGKWLNTAEQKLQNFLSGHVGPVESVAISFDGRILASGSYDETIKIWNLHTGLLLHTLKKHVGPVESVAISSDGQTLASGSADQTIKIWNMRTGELWHTLSGHIGAVKCVAVSSDGQTLASGSTDKTIRVWNMHTGEELLRIRTEHERIIECVAISSDGQTFASGSADKTIKVWEK